MAKSSSGASFRWGEKEAGSDSSYESMHYDGVWYNLYDCVFCRSGMEKPFVGKLMRLYEDEQGVRKVRVRWFFRPDELPLPVINDLSKDILTSNELFVAVGNMKGVENENLVGVICGKANVLCTATYGKNVMPSHGHIDEADHIFDRAYDVAQRKVVKMAKIQNKQLAQKFVNKPEWLMPFEGVEVETTIEEKKLSSEMKNQGSVTKKRQLVRTSCMSRVKKLKGKEKVYT